MLFRWERATPVALMVGVFDKEWATGVARSQHKSISFDKPGASPGLVRARSRR